MVLDKKGYSSPKARRERYRMLAPCLILSTRRTDLSYLPPASYEEEEASERLPLKEELIDQASLLRNASPKRASIGNRPSSAFSPPNYVTQFTPPGRPAIMGFYRIRTGSGAADLYSIVNILSSILRTTLCEYLFCRSNRQSAAGIWGYWIWKSFRTLKGRDCDRYTSPVPTFLYRLVTSPNFTSTSLPHIQYHFQHQRHTTTHPKMAPPARDNIGVTLGYYSYPYFSPNIAQAHVSSPYRQPTIAPDFSASAPTTSLYTPSVSSRTRSSAYTSSVASTSETPTATSVSPAPARKQLRNPVPPPSPSRNLSRAAVPTLSRPTHTLSSTRPEDPYPSIPAIRPTHSNPQLGFFRHSARLRPSYWPSPQLLAVKAAMGADAWDEYVALVEKCLDGEMDMDEFNEKKRSVFRMEDAAAERRLERLVVEMIEKGRDEKRYEEMVRERGKLSDYERQIIGDMRRGLFR
ncbi:hypothetical protein K469DRAFT_686953 [Zopfia rhizophila CBS 207.26]|uniref:Uncharacterized protein n=1 Tax=Zopfia rhizophila CBS 207.26 TaxID=1314779 RepID=A0A6A6E430_9PEZI|nr:hypothetical protein K469DRAFT_686953 [Zopfia rhizophila CBS 207.26]